jgi:hypothetical protein
MSIKLKEIGIIVAIILVLGLLVTLRFINTHPKYPSLNKGERIMSTSLDSSYGTTFFTIEREDKTTKILQCGYFACEEVFNKNK